MHFKVEVEVEVNRMIITVDREVDLEGNYLFFSCLENSGDRSSSRRIEHHSEERKEENNVKSEFPCVLI